MALDEAEKARMSAMTLETAHVLADDLRFIRAVLIKPFSTAGDVRRIAVLLRRLLIEGELSEVAAPRIGRVIINVPDNKATIAASASEWRFHSANIPPMFSLPLDTMGSYSTGKIDPNAPPGSTFVLPEPSGPNHKMRHVRIEGFLSDPVARHGSTLIRRSDVIKYICYRGHGVHTRGQEEPVFSLIEDARYILMVRRLGNAVELATRDLGDKPPTKQPDQLDLALLHLFSTAYYLCNSASVSELESLIFGGYTHA